MLTPVVDAMAARPDVNPDRIALIGVSQAGYWVPRALAFDLYQEVLKYRLGDEVRTITTPILITEPEGEQFWPGQSQALYDLLPVPGSW